MGVWWARWPTANIGVSTGRASGLVVIDLDGDAGRASWERLLAEHAPVPETATVATPHGAHLCYRVPSGLSAPRRIGARERLDILGDRGCAVVPPSAVPCAKTVEQHEPGHCTGGYTWTRSSSIATLPDWVAALACERDWAPHLARDATRDGGHKTYGQAAIDGEAARVATRTVSRQRRTRLTARRPSAVGSRPHLRARRRRRRRTGDAHHRLRPPRRHEPAPEPAANAPVIPTLTRQAWPGGEPRASAARDNTTSGPVGSAADVDGLPWAGRHSRTLRLFLGCGPQRAGSACRS
ncbi:MAG: bifunctional DNA primase/polymerase, partial [Egibacteraceae bacterium]